MIETIKLFDDASLRLLRSFLGWTLEGYEAYVMFEEPDQVYKRVRLDFGGGIGFDLVNEHQSIVMGPEASTEDVSILGIEERGPEKLWCPRGKQTTRRALDLYVDDILLVVDTARLTKGSIPVNKLKLVQALVFRSGGQLVVFDRDIWFDEYLTVRQGVDVDALVRDNEGDWEAEPPFGYTFERDLISLAHGGIRV